MPAHFRPGDCVIYRKPKCSVHPGPHATGIRPAPHGDYYAYCVHKFWRVVCVQPDQKVVVRTRRGKEHTLAASDPALRRAHWWERVLLHDRFPPPTPPG